MSLTVAGIEGELVAKLKGVLSNRFFQLSLITNGSNPDLRGPIRRAVRCLGGNTADPLAVVDSDLATITGWDVERLIDWAKLEVLKVCCDQFVDVDIQTGEDEQRLSQFKAQLQAEITALEQRLSRPYGPSMNPTTVGPMNGSPGIPNDPFQPRATRSTWHHWPYP